MNFILNLIGIVLLPFLLLVLLMGVTLLCLKVLIESIAEDMKGIIKCLKHLLLE